MSLGKILLHENFLDHLVLLPFVHSSYDVNKFICCEPLDRGLGLIGLFSSFSRLGFQPSCLQWAITPNVPLLFTVKAKPLFSEGNLFFFGQGSPGMGTSRGKIHDIWVFGKFLLPLLSGWLLSERFLGLVLPPSKDILPYLVLLMLMNCCFNPIAEMGELINRFKVDHRPLESLGKSLEELLTDHGFIYVVFSHPDHMFEICNVFIKIALFHFEGEDIPSCKIFAHVVLECFSKVVDDCGPDPFICISAPKSQMFGNYLAGVLYPCFYSGSLDVSQK